MKIILKQFKELFIQACKLIIKNPWIVFLSTYGLIFRDMEPFNKELNKIESGYYDH